MKILGIETSCDETAVAVVEDGRKVLSSVVYSQIDEHNRFGGVVPEIASRRHIENIVKVCNESIERAKLMWNDIDAIGVTNSPGLIGALLVGVNFAKGLAYSLNKPLISVNHIAGHIAANYIDNQNLKPPFLCLVVSGGHTQIVEVLERTKFNIIGTTRDDAVGEAFDKVSRVLGLGYPGGIKIENNSQLGDDNYYKLPYPKLSGNPYDFSFSGLKTSVINLIYKNNQNNEEINVENMCASFQRVAIDILCDKFVSAAKNLNYKNLVIAGGVSANSLLRLKLRQICDSSGFNLYMPDLLWCGDNAAMISVQAYYEFLNGNISALELNANSDCFVGK